MEEEEEKTEGQGLPAAEEGGAAPAASNRDAFLAMLREYDPEMDGENNEDDYIWERAKGFMGRHGEMKGQMEAVTKANDKLAEVISQDPSVAEFISMIANGSNPWYALGKVFGNMVDQLDDDSLEQLNKGQEEYKGRIASMRANFEKYKADLKSFVEENGLTPENEANINNCILDIADALNTGDIGRSIIENVWKGMDEDERKEAELAAAVLAAKNKAIEDMKNKRGKSAGLPDTGSSVGTKRNPVARKSSMEMGSLMNTNDPLADSEKIR